MAVTWADRALTIAVTATLTSALWIVGGAGFIELARRASGLETAQPAQSAPGPSGNRASPEANQAREIDEREAAGLIIPVVGVRAEDLSDTFSDARGGGARLHEALDIMAPEGTAVVAAAPGRIEKLFRSDPGGNTIYVRSDDKLTIYYYAHLKNYADGLEEGQPVRRGQRLGRVGHTGNASAGTPHLHFALMRTTADAHWWEPATALNPYPLLAKKAP